MSMEGQFLADQVMLYTEDRQRLGVLAILELTHMEDLSAKDLVTIPMDDQEVLDDLAQLVRELELMHTGDRLVEGQAMIHMEDRVSQDDLVILVQGLIQTHMEDQLLHDQVMIHMEDRE